MTAPDPGDPGGSTAPVDLAVSRVAYGLSLLGVAGPAEAADVLDVCSHDLSPEQVTAVLALIGVGGWTSGGCPDPPAE